MKYIVVVVDLLICTDATGGKGGGKGRKLNCNFTYASYSYTHRMNTHRIQVKKTPRFRTKKIVSCIFRPVSMFTDHVLKLLPPINTFITWFSFIRWLSLFSIPKNVFFFFLQKNTYVIQAHTSSIKSMAFNSNGHMVRLEIIIILILFEYDYKKVQSSTKCMGIQYTPFSLQLLEF